MKHMAAQDEDVSMHQMHVHRVAPMIGLHSQPVFRGVCTSLTSLVRFLPSLPRPHQSMHSCTSVCSHASTYSTRPGPDSRVGGALPHTSHSGSHHHVPGADIPCAFPPFPILPDSREGGALTRASRSGAQLQGAAGAVGASDPAGGGQRWGP